MTPQEFADQQYGTGMRDGRVEAISAILDMISDSDLEYTASQIRDHLMHLERNARNRRNRYP
jgi:hypothetical protein